MYTTRISNVSDFPDEVFVYKLYGLSHIGMICYSETPMPDDPTKCSKCCKKEVQYQAENILIRDATIPRLEGNKRAYICSVCDRIFGSSHNLKRHHMIHTGYANIAFILHYRLNN